MKSEMKQVLIKAINTPMIAILKILETRDDSEAKLRAINLYCRFILKTINKTIDKYLDNEK